MMYVHWKSLITVGLGVWTLLYLTDLLGESSWKRYSSHIDDILKSQYNEIVGMQKGRSQNGSGTRLNWSLLIWNICAFLCSLVFFSVIRSVSWIVWKLYRVYRNQDVFSQIFKKKIKISTTSIKKADSSPTVGSKPNCKLLFKNQSFTQNKDVVIGQQHESLHQQLEETKKENGELSQQLLSVTQENSAIKQQLEVCKVESTLMREKLAKSNNSLKANLKHKEFSSVNQEVLMRKTQNLELHLQEVTRDRDLLKNKLGSLEKNYGKLQEKLSYYQKHELKNVQVPEKDNTQNKTNDTFESEITEGEIDLGRFQKKMVLLQKIIPKVENFGSNSKLSLDLEESSLDTSKENDSEIDKQKNHDIAVVKQNLVNYNLYKTQMLRPKIQLDNINETICSATDTTGSSSDDNSAPHRIISSTAEFQNFLKNLNSQSTSSFKKNLL